MFSFLMPTFLQVLHGVTVPEHPSFLPILPVPHGKDVEEAGCQALSCKTAAEAVAEGVTMGLFPSLTGAERVHEVQGPSTSYRPKVADYQRAYKSGVACVCCKLYNLNA